MAMPKYDWTEDRVEKLSSMWRDGKSASEIMRALPGSVSRSAVIGKVHRLKLPRRDLGAAPLRAYPSSRPRPAAKRVSHNKPQPVKRTPPRPYKPQPFVELEPTATIHTLAPRGCKWPIGEPGDDAFGFCGRLREGSGPYCGDHGRIAWRKSRAA